MRQLVHIVLLSLSMFTATMADRGVSISYAGEGGKSLAGSFAVTSTGFLSICENPGGCSAATPTPVPFNAAAVGQGTFDPSGNFCGTFAAIKAEVAGTAVPAVGETRALSGGFTTFDPATGQGEVSFSVYKGGGCNGAVFLNAGATLVATGTAHAVVSDEGNRIDAVVTSYNNFSGKIAGLVCTMALTRQGH